MNPYQFVRRFVLGIAIGFISTAVAFAAGDKPPANQGGPAPAGNQPTASDSGQGAQAPAGEASTGSAGSGTTSDSGSGSGAPNLQGTVWDHVPSGGSIRAQADGSWDVLDKSGNVIKNVKDGGASTGSAGSGASTDSSGSGVNLKGTIWDEVPAGGAIRSQADGSWDILDKNGNVIKNVRTGDSKASGDSTSSAGSGGGASPPTTPPVPPPVQQVDYLPTGSTVTHTQNPDGTWSHHFNGTTADGNTLDYDLKPGDSHYPTGHSVYDPPKPYDPLAPQGDGPFETPLEDGSGYIRSHRDKDGKWHHRLHREVGGGVLDFEMKPDHPRYPHDDLRFPKPLDPLPNQQMSANFGDDLKSQAGNSGMGRELAMAGHDGEHPDEHPHADD